ncbi:hypothetical protein OsI_22691 [Oryza sativa Indica Group]|jgi:hypothetical protein|uniref:Uncharacterized protein n=1 Tax=Oryza sativa subsp. indica TaxID=39946 RepID=A2YC60_ORYSI|nr:hypothetical protein OsI_22691 [Oryza sativa Indica Group]
MATLVVPPGKPPRHRDRCLHCYTKFLAKTKGTATNAIVKKLLSLYDGLWINRSTNFFQRLQNLKDRLGEAMMVQNAETTLRPYCHYLAAFHRLWLLPRRYPTQMNS